MRSPQNWPAASGGLQQAFCRCEGRLVSGAVPLPVVHLWVVWLVRGTPPQLKCVRFSELAFRAVGLEGGRPPGRRRVSLRGMSEVWRFPPPRLPGHRACCRGPSPTCCGAGCARMGAQHCPFGCLHALRGAACRRGRGGPSPWGWPSTVARAVWCEALSLSWLPARVLLPVCPRHGWYGHGGPAARALVSRRCALSGRREGISGRGALRRCEGRLRSGARPPPAAQPQGGP